MENFAGIFVAFLMMLSVFGTAFASVPASYMQLPVPNSETSIAKPTIAIDTGAKITNIWQEEGKLWAKITAPGGSPALYQDGYKATLQLYATCPPNALCTAQAQSETPMEFDSSLSYYYGSYAAAGFDGTGAYSATVRVYKDGTPVAIRTQEMNPQPILYPIPPQPSPITPIPMPPKLPAASIYLSAGWNMISTDATLFVSDIKSNCDLQGSIWHYDNGAASYARVSNSLSMANGYWVKVGSKCKVPLHSPVYYATGIYQANATSIYPAKYTMKLGKGWNQIGAISLNNEPAAYNAQESTCKMQNGPFYYDAEEGYKLSTLQNMQAGVGYWVKAQNDCTLVFSPSEEQPPAPPSG